MASANVEKLTGATPSPPPPVAPPRWRSRHATTIAGAVVLGIGLVLVVAGAPLFGRAPYQRNADFPTCILACDGNAAATILVAIGGAHVLAGGVMIAVDNNR